MRSPRELARRLTALEGAVRQDGPDACQVELHIPFVGEDDDDGYPPEQAPGRYPTGPGITLVIFEAGTGTKVAEDCRREGSNAQRT